MEYFIYYSIFHSDICPLLYMYNSENYIIKISWLINKKLLIKTNAKIIYKPLISFEKELYDYFNKKIKKINSKLLNNKQTEFEKLVIDELKKIKYGSIITYKQIAIKIKKYNASRAVGQICRKNMYPIVIPCHRVVASNGYGGYSGKNIESINLKIKKKLLELEGVNIINFQYKNSL